MTPEAEARLKIDERLIQTGWVIQNVKQLNLSEIQPKFQDGES